MPLFRLRRFSCSWAGNPHAKLNIGAYLALHSRGHIKVNRERGNAHSELAQETQTHMTQPSPRERTPEIGTAVVLRSGGEGSYIERKRKEMGNGKWGPEHALKPPLTKITEERSAFSRCYHRHERLGTSPCKAPLR